MALLPLCLIIALAAGPIPVSLAQTLNWLVSLLFGDSSADVTNSMVLEHIRAPRSLLAVLLGAGLAVSGAAMQGLFRNPLADPSLIGVTAGASTGASLAIVFGAGLVSSGGFAGLSLVAMGAFVGGALCVVLVYKLANGPNGTSVANMLLAGIAISALAGATNSSLEYVADNEMLRRISLWRMGGLDGTNWQHVGMAAFSLLIVMLRLPKHSQGLNALLLGESEARHLGINVQFLKTELIILVAFIVGVSVALAGSIAFVGLVVPHIIRILIGPDHRYLLPASALFGGVLLLFSDALARSIIAPSELPIGILTAALGAPFFISLLRRRHDYGLA